MSNQENGRKEAIEAFLKRAGWGAAQLRPLAGDASTRRYVRLEMGSQKAMLMDAPPRAESAACPPGASAAERERLGYNAMARLAGPDSRRFAAFSRLLRKRGLSAPDVIAADYPAGLLLLEDLGDDLFARVIAGGTAPTELYAAAIDVLIDLHGEPAPEAMALESGPSVPLLEYDALAYRAEVDLLLDWLYPMLAGREIAADLRAEWAEIWRRTFRLLDGAERRVVLRDYHAENLFWLPSRSNLRRVGLIDFQDGLAGARGYDLVSLLEDARRDVEPDLRRAMFERYASAAAADPHFDPERFRAETAILGAQRNAKILGIFARLSKRDGKTAYLRLIPRVWRYIEGDLAAPGLEDLRRWLDKHLPKELRGEPKAA